MILHASLDGYSILITPSIIIPHTDPENGDLQEIFGFFLLFKVVEQYQPGSVKTDLIWPQRRLGVLLRS